MFTGIIESIGKINSLIQKKGNLAIGVESTFTKSLKVGQSVAHNGVCLTVESKKGKIYFVTAVKETLLKTNLGSLIKGQAINLERCLKIGVRLDGHFVQGHIDTTASCKKIVAEKGSWLFTFEIRNAKSGEKKLLINKGSVCINGVALTVINPKAKSSTILFSVAIIPHTFKNTNFKNLRVSDKVNIEFDVLGKYIQQIISK